jgi:hypothetical protein
MQGHTLRRRFRVSPRQAHSFYDRIGDVLLSEVPVVAGLEMGLRLDVAFYDGRGDTNLSDMLWLQTSNGPRLTRYRNIRQHWPMNRVRIMLPEDTDHANDLIAKGWTYERLLQGDVITRQVTEGWFRWDLLGHLFDDSYSGA